MAFYWFVFMKLLFESCIFRLFHLKSCIIRIQLQKKCSSVYYTLMKSIRHKDIGILMKLGISEMGTRVYLELLRVQKQDISSLARNLKIYRTDVYRGLSELLSLKLATPLLAGKRKVYEPSSPDILLSLLKQQEQDVTESVEHLEQMFLGSKNNSSIRHFQGKVGIKMLYEFLIQDAKRGTELLRIESPSVYQKHRMYYPPIYWKRVSAKKNGDIQRKNITSEAIKLLKPDVINRFSKAIPSQYGPFDFDVSTLVIENKIAFIDLKSEQGYVFENKEFASYFKILFKILYTKI